MTTRISVFLMAITFAAALPAQQPAGHFPRGISYEIFVRSFADSNGDGIGDLPGITGKLDYLRELGVDILWLTPICPSPSYHKYDVTDYYSIDPEYGTIEDFKTLVREVHARNMHIIVDMVFNHSSDQHPWFQGAARSKDNPYRDYYLWSADPTEWKKDNPGNWTYVSDQGRRPKPGEPEEIRPGEEKYFGFFWRKMPDLNYDNPKVREEVLKIGQWWLKETQVDGFRLDAIRHIYRDELREKNVDWWKTFLTAMQEVKPDVYLVGEVWDAPEGIAPFFAGVPALFNFGISRAILNVVKNGKDEAGDLVTELNSPLKTSIINAHQGSLVPTMMAIRKLYAAVNPAYIDATMLSNHDQNRYASDLGGDKQKIRLAAALLLTLPGSPYLYYGEEIGMLGVKPDEHIREPMLWTTPAPGNEVPSWQPSEYSPATKVAPVREQLETPESLLNHYRSLIALRNGDEALADGDLEQVTHVATFPAEIIGFCRIAGSRRTEVYHNLSGTPQVFSRDLPPGAKVVWGRISSNGNRHALAPYESVVIRMAD